MIKDEHESVRSHDFCCTMSRREAEVRALVAELLDFKGKIVFFEDELATKDLNLDNRVVGVTSMADFRDTALLRLFASRVAAVDDFDQSLGKLGVISNKEQILSTYLEQVEKQDEGKPIMRIRAWGE